MLPTKTEQLILETLQAKGEMYGLLMVKTEPRLKRGTIYVLLGRLEEAKWVTSRLEDKPETQSGMPRRLYALTGLGQRALNARHVASQVYAGNLVLGGI